MSTFGERLAAEKSKQKPFSDVQILFGGELETFRFRRLSGREWAAITARNPLRLDSPIDKQYGYNFHGAGEEAARASGVRMDGEDEVKLRVDPPRTKPDQPEPVDEWADLFGAIEGAQYTLIVDAIWDLNEWGPYQRLEAAKKASARMPVSDKR